MVESQGCDCDLVTVTLTVTLTVKTGNNLFEWHFSSWWCIAIISLVTKRFGSSENIIWLNIHWNVLPFAVTVTVSTQIKPLTLKTAIQSLHKTHQLWSCTIIPKFECLLWPWPVTNKAVQYFHQTFWLTMIYHQSKFGCERIISS